MTEAKKIRKTLYLDCFSGIAGDMTLAALVDLGADPAYIESELRRLPLDPFTMAFVPTVRRGISAKLLKLTFPEHDAPQGHAEGHVHRRESEQGRHEHGHAHPSHDHLHVHDHAHTHEHPHAHDHARAHQHDHEHGHGHAHTHGHPHSHGHEHDHHHEHRKAADILAMIEASDLPARVKERSAKVFERIAEAEGKIHGIAPSEVHFHEVGAMDSIIDIIGVCLALENLGVDDIVVSPIPTGMGKVRIAHGLYPVPAPATAELLRGIPLASMPTNAELTTPTGAGIAKALASGFGPIPEGTIDRIGYGAGNKDFEFPNVLRAILLHRELPSAPGERVVVLEAQIDDSSGETMGYAMERLLASGALDVYYTPVYMKKNRPGVLATVVCLPEDAAACEATLLAETSTFGVRRSERTRRMLDRKWQTVETPYGRVRVKLGYENGELVQASPEFEDAAQAARLHGVPLQTVYREALRRIGESSHRG
jgi:hypothetical protein